MRPGLYLALLLAVLALFIILLGGAAVWAIIATGMAPEPRAVLLIGSAGILLLLALLVGVWVALELRLVRPVEAITREIETLSHARTVRPIEIADGHVTGGLVDALQELIAKFIAARQQTHETVANAVERGETYKRRLEAILLDMSEGVIVCNLDNRILLYNQAAVRILKRPEALGLGRRLFAMFDRGPVLENLSDLIARQRADKTRKLRVRRQISCERHDDGAPVNVRLALICSDAVETEGYVLTFTETEDTDEEEDTLPPRPEFYDFDLFTRQPDREVTEIPLRELRCVVFDTETTGLEPSEGDEMISIGAVRVVNGRIVRGETLEQLINPGRTIPKASTRFHGLTDEDVRDMPLAKDALPRFHAFAGRAVLVAHNAAFDIKFLELKEKAAGLSFTNPVLDVLLLSAFLHDHASDHSLGATAERLGVDISNRHTALGDALSTAEIFLAMLDPLHQRGVITLGDALNVSEKMVKIRKQQAKF